MSRCRFASIIVVVLTAAQWLIAAGPDSERSPQSLELFEEEYAKCLRHNASSRLSESQVDCVCEQTANHMVRWLEQGQEANSLPPLPQSVEARCLK